MPCLAPFTAKRLGPEANRGRGGSSVRVPISPSRKRKPGSTAPEAAQIEQVEPDGSERRWQQGAWLAAGVPSIAHCPRCICAESYCPAGAVDKHRITNAMPRGQGLPPACPLPVKADVMVIPASSPSPLTDILLFPRRSLESWAMEISGMRRVNTILLSRIRKIPILKIFFQGDLTIQLSKGLHLT